MKKFLLSSMMVMVGVIAFAQEKAAEISFQTTTHEFGTILEGTQATVDFEFVNKGDAPLVLSNVSASCGCTIPTWPKEPIMPGQSGKITAVYNSTGRVGSFTKSITVTSNAKNGTLILTIKGVVEAKKTAPVSPVQNQPKP
ncbi:MAG TPA: DUF1573 domain-containing protein [Bacteroidetes bacterium]|nr:DUF1573 domain-containing protein [Bacteroidota bacterium]